MSQPRVVIYTRKWCGYCSAAIRLLDKEQIPYEHIDMSGDWVGLEELKQRTGHPTVPQVLVDDKLIGGFNELKAYFNRHGRDSLV